MKKDRTGILLLILSKFLKKFPKYDYLSCQAWQSNDGHTLRIILEVTMSDEKSPN